MEYFAKRPWEGTSAFEVQMGPQMSKRESGGRPLADENFLPEKKDVQVPKSSKRRRKKLYRAQLAVGDLD